MAPSFGCLSIINKGVSGDWAFKAINRFDQDVICLNPNALVLLIGTNDLGNGQPIDGIVKNIELMVKRATEENISVIICSILPVRNEYVANHPSKDIVFINSELYRLSCEYEVDYVDFYSNLIDGNGFLKAEFTSDGLHPNRTGYLRMSKILFPYLVRTINCFS